MSGHDKVYDLDDESHPRAALKNRELMDADEALILVNKLDQLWNFRIHSFTNLDYATSNKFKNILNKIKSLLANHTNPDHVLLLAINQYLEYPSLDNYNIINRETRLLKKYADSYTKEPSMFSFNKSKKRDAQEILAESEIILSRAYENAENAANQMEEINKQVVNCSNHIDKINIVIGQIQAYKKPVYTAIINKLMKEKKKILNVIKDIRQISKHNLIYACKGFLMKPRSLLLMQDL